MFRIGDFVKLIKDQYWVEEISQHEDHTLQIIKIKAGSSEDRLQLWCSCGKLAKTFQDQDNDHYGKGILFRELELTLASPIETIFAQI